jgi:hypothetical protein
MICVFIKNKIIHSGKSIEVVLAFCVPLEISGELYLAAWPTFDGNCTLRRADDSYRSAVAKVSQFVPCRGAGKQQNRIGVNGPVFLKGQ